MINRPETTFQILAASQLAGVQDHRVLAVGQMLAAGTATAGALVQIGNNGEENTLFGRRSMLAKTVREFKRYNPRSALYCIPLADAGAAVKAAGVVTFAGTATEDNTLYISVGSVNQHRYTLDVLSGDLHTEVSAAFTALITADADAPFTAVDVAGTVTVTFENAGTFGNDAPLKVDGTVAGITAGLTAFASGATDPTLTSVLDAVGNLRMNTVLWPSGYALTTVEAWLNARFNASNAVLDGVAVQTLSDTLANLKSGSNQNSQSIVIMGMQAISETTRDGNQQGELSDVISARFCAVRSLRLTEDAPLTQFLTTTASKDQYGGIALASLPYFNTLFPENLTPAPADEFTDLELIELEESGVSVLGANRAFNEVILGPAVTTYLTNAAGSADESFKFLNTVDTSSVVREFFYENCRVRFAQTRLTDGDVLDGRDMANASTIRAFMNSLYKALSLEALTQLGREAQRDFDDNLVITVTVSNGTATVDCAPLLVGQLRVILGTIQINFGG